MLKLKNVIKIKLILFFWFPLTLIFYCWFILWPDMYFSTWQIHTQDTFQNIVNGALEMPSLRDKLIINREERKVEYMPYDKWMKQYFIKEDTDIEHISYDEWMSMKCEKEDDIYFLMDPNFKRYSEEELKRRRHINCINARMGATIDKKYCSDIRHCIVIMLRVNEYVLKYPKVLSNLLKVAAKPCYYLKEYPNLKQEDPDAPVALAQINSAKSALGCNKRGVVASILRKKREYSLIDILDSKHNIIHTIMVPRKDIK